jgi:hypothetical protein
VDGEEIGRLIGELEIRVERLRALYEQYFMGIERLEPLTVRKDIDRRLWALRREQIRNTGLRFKLETTIQRYNTYQQYWQRIVREIESGTYQRDLGRAAQRFGDNVVTGFARRRQKMYEKGVEKQAEREAQRNTGASNQAPPAETAEAATVAASDAYDVTFEDSETVEPAVARIAYVPSPEPIEPLELDIGESSRPPPRAVPAVAKPAIGLGEPRRAPPSPPGLPPIPVRPAAPAPPRPALAPSSGLAVPVAAKPVAPTAAAGRPFAPAAPVAVPAKAAAPALVSAKPATPFVTAAKPVAPLAAAKPAMPPSAPVKPGAAAPSTAVVAPTPMGSPLARPAAIGQVGAGALAAKPALPAAPKPAPPAIRPPAPSRPDARGPAVLSEDNGLSPIRMRQIYGAFVEAKRRANESTATVTYEKIATNLENVARELRAKHKARSVDFEVIMKNGKPVLKPVVKG